MKLSNLQNRIGVDKIAHFAMWGFATSLASNLPLWPAVAAFVIIALSAIFKEILDRREGKKFTWADIFAGWLGMLPALVIFILKNLGVWVS